MIDYKVDGKIAIVTGSKDKEVELKIPEEIDGYIVSKIAEDAFCENDTLKKVYIPKTVKVISSYAFSSCSKLSEVVIAEGTEVIEDWAFAACPITKLILPPTLRNVGQNAFLGSDCKAKVDDFLKMKNRPVQKRSIKNNACLYPISLNLDYNTVTIEDITKRSEYIDHEFDALERGYTDYFSLDVPFLFNKDQFIYAIYSDVKLDVDYFSVDLTNETKKQIGGYKENDTAFIASRIDLLNHNKKLSTVDAKMPYLEKANFIVEDVTEVNKDNQYIYFLKVTIEIESFGNGNIDFEFSFNAIDDIQGKYQSEYDKKIISDADFNNIEATLKQLKIDTIGLFLRSLVGAPQVSLISNLYYALVNDAEVDVNKVVEYHEDQLLNYYYTLTNLQSLIDIAFNIEPHVKAMEEATGQKMSALIKKYKLKLVDDEGNLVKKEDLQGFIDNFPNVQENYFLHAEMVEDLMAKLDEINRDYAILSYRK